MNKEELQQRLEAVQTESCFLVEVISENMKKIANLMKEKAELNIELNKVTDKDPKDVYRQIKSVSETLAFAEATEPILDLRGVITTSSEEVERQITEEKEDPQKIAKDLSKALAIKTMEEALKSSSPIENMIKIADIKDLKDLFSMLGGHK